MSYTETCIQDAQTWCENAQERVLPNTIPVGIEIMKALVALVEGYIHDNMHLRIERERAERELSELQSDVMLSELSPGADRLRAQLDSKTNYVAALRRENQTLELEMAALKKELAAKILQLEASQK